MRWPLQFTLIAAAFANAAALLKTCCHECTN